MWLGARRVLAVVAHPDDESFGLGAVIASMTRGGAAVSLLCFTHGEASTIGAADDLGAIRAAELRAAGDRLGIEQTWLLDYADGALSSVAGDALEAEIERRIGAADALLVFEPGGVTSHPDHRAVTAAARRVADRRRLATVEWGLGPDVAAQLGPPFVAMAPEGDVRRIVVDRTRQLEAIACHRSQLDDDPVVCRRLAVQGDVEHVRVTRRA